MASFMLSSCQKETKSVVQLANDLTQELRQITDSASADAHAARVAVMNKRFQNASVRAFSMNGTPILSSSEGGDSPGAAYADALKNLAREIGRVRAGFPSASHDGEVDEGRLFISIAKVQGVKGTPDELKDAGMRYMQDTGNESHSTIPGEHLPAYYGSEKLEAALAYRADINQVGSFDSEPVPPVPALSKESQEAPTPSSGHAEEAAGEEGEEDDS